MFQLRFYEVNKAYGCFSNFERAPVELDGATWPSSEHYFQAQKFVREADRHAVLEAATPFAAAQIGRDRTRPLRGDWAAIRDEVMYRALTAKFEQHPGLADVLFWTCDAELIEHTHNDSYWADGGDGTGVNRLGQLLMQLRTRLGGGKGAFRPPPWIAQPDADPSDLFWRMGGGEGYRLDLNDWLAAMPAHARVHYDRLFPVPEEWRGSW